MVIFKQLIKGLNGEKVLLCSPFNILSSKQLNTKAFIGTDPGEKTTAALRKTKPLGR